jgi:fructose-1,6-bisphosphatase/inositol monophosphatase family enzyme
MANPELSTVIPESILHGEYGEEAQFATTLAYRLGNLMCANLTVGHAARSKVGGSRITDDDVLNNQTAIEAVKSRFPRDSLLGEERSNMISGSRRVWVLDPIDGTRAYEWGVPVSTVLLGLMVDYEPQLVLCLNPYVSQLFMAADGKGAYLNGEKCAASGRSKLAKSIIGTTGPSDGELLDITGARYDLGRKEARAQIVGSTGYESALIGAGQFDGQIFGGSTRHDILFGSLFIPEAKGGQATDLRGDPLDFSQPLTHGAVLSNGKFHDELLGVIESRVRC